MPRPTMEAATPIPALAPALRELEGTSVGVADGGELDGRGEGVLVRDVDTNAEDVEDVVMLLLVAEVAEDDVVELDAACLVKDCGDGA